MLDPDLHLSCVVPTTLPGGLPAWGVWNQGLTRRRIQARCIPDTHVRLWTILSSVHRTRDTLPRATAPGQGTMTGVYWGPAGGVPVGVLPVRHGRSTSLRACRWSA